MTEEKRKWIKGDDFIEVGADFPTWGITFKGNPEHVNAVEVYTSEKDRDMIVDLLNKGVKDG